MTEKYYLGDLNKILSAVRRFNLLPDATFAREQAFSLRNIFFDDIENIISGKKFFFLRSEKTVQPVNENKVGSH